MVRFRWFMVGVVLTGIVTMACGAGGRSSTQQPAPGATGTTRADATPTPALSGELAVFAAASLSDAFTDVGAEFTKVNPRVNVRFNFAASTALRTQIEQGARADIFASADQIQMDNARKANVIDGPDVLFVKNKLVMIAPTSRPGKVTGLQDLARPGLKFVLTDKNVPIGAYARAALDKMAADPQFGADFAQKALANLRSEEANVRAVVTKVQLGEADAGIVYASDVTPSVAKEITSIPIPEPFNVTAAYPIAVVRDASNKAAATAFITFARSPTGQEILKKHNFIVDADTGAP